MESKTQFRAASAEPRVLRPDAEHQRASGAMGSLGLERQHKQEPLHRLRHEQRADDEHARPVSRVLHRGCRRLSGAQRPVGHAHHQARRAAARCRQACPGLLLRSVQRRRQPGRLLRQRPMAVQHQPRIQRLVQPPRYLLQHGGAARRRRPVRRAPRPAARIQRILVHRHAPRGQRPALRAQRPARQPVERAQRLRPGGLGRLLAQHRGHARPEPRQRLCRPARTPACLLFPARGPRAALHGRQPPRRNAGGKRRRLPALGQHRLPRAVGGQPRAQSALLPRAVRPGLPARRLQRRRLRGVGTPRLAPGRQHRRRPCDHGRDAQRRLLRRPGAGHPRQPELSAPGGRTLWIRCLPLQLFLRGRILQVRLRAQHGDRAVGRLLHLRLQEPRSRAHVDRLRRQGGHHLRKRRGGRHGPRRPQGWAGWRRILQSLRPDGHQHDRLHLFDRSAAGDQSHEPELCHASGRFRRQRAVQARRGHEPQQHQPFRRRSPRQPAGPGQRCLPGLRTGRLRQADLGGEVRRDRFRAQQDRLGRRGNLHRHHRAGRLDHQSVHRQQRLGRHDHGVLDLP